VGGGGGGAAAEGCLGLAAGFFGGGFLTGFAGAAGSSATSTGFGCKCPLSGMSSMLSVAGWKPVRVKVTV
jgi:hypothetical protein